MLRLAIATALCSQMPQATPPPAVLAERPLELSIRANDHWFVAENLSQLDELLFLGSRELGVLATVALEPGEAVSWPFSRGLEEELLVELLVLDPEGWRNSGALSLRDAIEAPGGALWLFESGGRTLAWRAAGARVELVAPRTGLLPAAFHAAAPASLHDHADEGAPPLHVPVITPDGLKRKSKPPVIEKKPLPPV